MVFYLNEYYRHWFGFITILQLTKYTSPDDFFVVGKNERNPRLIYFQSVLECKATTGDFLLEKYSDRKRSRESRTVVIGKSNRLLITDSVIEPNTMQTFIICGSQSEPYMVKFVYPGFISLKGSTREMLGVKYVIPGFRFVCSSKHLTNVIFKSSHPCRNANRVIIESIYQSTMIVSSCNQKPRTISYICYGTDGAGKIVNKTFQYEILRKYEIYLQYPDSFITVNDKISCRIQTFGLEKNNISNYNIRVFGNNKMITDMIQSSVNLSISYDFTVITKYSYCCQHFNMNLMGCTLRKKLLVMRTPMYFFKPDLNNVALGQTLSCHVCILTTEQDFNLVIQDTTHCITSLQSSPVKRVRGMVSVVISEPSVGLNMSLGPSLNLYLPYSLGSNVTELIKVKLKISCKIHDGVQSVVTTSFTDCSLVKPDLRFTPYRIFYRQGESIMCQAGHNTCSDQLVFTISVQVGPNPTDHHVYPNQQFIHLKSYHAGSKVNFTCSVAFKKNNVKIIGSLQQLVRVEAPPSQMFVVNVRPTMGIGEPVVCHGYGYPRPRYHWVVHGLDILVVENEIMMITQIFKEKQYTATCLASNIWGLSSVNISFFVYNPQSRPKNSSVKHVAVLTMIAVVYFCSLIVILTLVFSESIYRIDTKKEKRAPKQVLSPETQKERDTEPSLDDFQNNANDSGTNNQSNRQQEKERRRPGRCKTVEQICTRDATREQLQCLGASDVVVVVRSRPLTQHYGDLVHSQQHFQPSPSGILNRTDYIREVNRNVVDPAMYRAQIMHEILTLRLASE